MFVFVLTGGASQVLAEGSRVCTADAISDCSPAGCRELSAIGSVTLDLPGRRHRFCYQADCRSGLLETYSGAMKPGQKGYVGFSELGYPGGFTGAVNLDDGAFTLIDGSRYWSGLCVLP